MKIVEMRRTRGWTIFALILTITSFCLAGGSNDNCWTNDAECVVQATLHRSPNTKGMGESLPLEIDCLTSSMEQLRRNPTAIPEYLLKRFERAFFVTLNGCRKAMKWPTFGFEYLPNCDKITEMKVTRFHADTSYELHCPSDTFTKLEILRFEYNEIATITTEALSHLALLKELNFKSNALRNIEGGAFDNLHFIERLHMEAESLLVIKDATLFERTNVVNLRLIQLKLVTSALFEKLPPTLRELHVEKTAIGVGVAAGAAEVAENAANVVNVNNSGMLCNVSLIDCALRIFRLNDDHGSVQYLNLSNNLLEEFKLTNNGSPEEAMKLKTLDLSYNRLKSLPLNWLALLDHLEKLYLNGNSMKTLPLMPILSNLPAIHVIDCRNNQLELLMDTTSDSLEDEKLYRLLIYIDNNPWNCKWLLAFAHSHPELFRIFHYEKFHSQINVNGLECVPEEPKGTSKQPFIAPELLDLEGNSSWLPVKDIDTDDIEDRLNVSTFTLIYGSPFDLKRNQRTEALIIVFMLPVGIAVLFLLLYLWIYCQKAFHLSYYRGCNFCKRRKRLNARCVNRFDVVRQVPPTATNATAATIVNNNEDYELPLNGVGPICNCAQSHSNSIGNMVNFSAPKECQKTHHITYVPLPDERPQKIYEEIVEGDAEKTINAVIGSTPNESHMNTIYDCLAFECSAIES